MVLTTQFGNVNPEDIFFRSSKDGVTLKETDVAGIQNKT